MKFLKHIGIPIGFVVFYLSIGAVFLFITKQSLISTLISDVLVAVMGYIYIMHMPTLHVKYSKKGLCLFLVCFLLFMVLMHHNNIAFQYYVTDISYDTYNAIVNQNIYLYVFISIIIAPFTEEILMRGIVYRHFKCVMPHVVACILSSFLFALLHGTLIHIMIGTLCGMMFTFVYEYTQKLCYPIVFHMLYNFLSCFVIGYVPLLIRNIFVLLTINAVVIGLLIACYVLIDGKNVSQTKDLKLSE